MQHDVKLISQIAKDTELNVSLDGELKLAFFENVRLNDSNSIQLILQTTTYFYK